MENNKHAMASDHSNTTHTTTPISSSSSSNNNKNDDKVYKGVRKRKWGKWVSEIRLPNSRERIWLGSHDSPEKAARAFDAALYCLRGRHANFNFPNTPCNMDGMTNVPLAVAPLTPQEIQEVASKFANQVPAQLQKPLHHHHDQEKQQQQPQRSSSTTTAPTTTDASSSCSTTVYECDGTVQVEHGDMDWTFLNVFDYSNEVGFDYDLYSELHKMHSVSGELLYSAPPPPPFQGNYEADDDDDDFSHHHSFLWNWNF